MCFRNREKYAARWETHRSLDERNTIQAPGAGFRIIMCSYINMEMNFICFYLDFILKLIYYIFFTSPVVIFYKIFLFCPIYYALCLLI